MLNPLNYTDADAGYILRHIFQSLLFYDSDNYTLVPQLAITRPEISEDGLKLTFEIRPEATWDNGSPITGHDVAFTIKVIKHPQVDCPHLKPYFEFVKDVVIDPKNPKRFTVIAKRKYFLAESAIGTEFVLPQYIYDPNDILNNYTIPQLDAMKNVTDPKLKAFADDFNSTKFQREVVVGSGPYKFISWETNDKIVLERKRDWWADKLASRHEVLLAFPEKIIYKVINDQNAAITALKAQNLDVMHGIRAKDFIELQQNEKIQTHYSLHTPPTFTYSYIGLNNRPPANRPPFFTDKRVRKAFAHLIDVNQIVDKILYGFAERIIGPISPLIPGAYNDTLKPIAYDLNRAKQLLEEAGWKDTDGDGILDKIIDGKKVDFRCEFAINQGNETRKNVALLIREVAKKGGIDIQVQSYEWSVYLEKSKNHDFDIMYSAWISSPEPPDLKQIWHTQSWRDKGSNYIGFGNEESDRLIELIQQELNENKRNDYYRRFQEILYEEVPCVFLVTSKERIAIHKRFRNARTSALRPGYQTQAFWVPKELVKYGKPFDCPTP
jgi:peptide/nickel transport system substrate-binding protein